ncbi:putative uncharacterized protein DDB_G0293878 [Anastrepha ludens]|uniref:putative uncharacterized protein DDB_G0293878 n=1 Tax=Anastrepha ludens TaxID=28586 RepID=UPI0023B0E2E9|nr:putative uncharacterized protein DDB_G0293878 [Anastrepha ludens]
MLLQWSTSKVDGAVLYNNDNYADAFYQDANYYDSFANPENDVGSSDAEQAFMRQGRMDNAQVEEGQDGPVQQLDNLQTGAEWEQDAGEQDRLSEMEKTDQLGMTDDEATHSKREISDNHYSQRYGQEQRSAYVCHGQTPEQQACLDAAVKDTKDTIEHVTLLIKRMREHAVAIVKELNELEGDFLGACQDERSKAANPTNPTNPTNPKRPPQSKANCKELFGHRGDNSSGVGYIDVTGGFKRIDTDGDNNNNQNKLIYVSTNNRNDNDNENTNNPVPSNGQRGDYSNSGNNQNVNTNTKSNSTGAATKARILINEFGLPIKSDASDLPPSEFLEQAQFAVHAWKNQIEECKRLLDEQISRAAQHQPTDNVDGPVTNVQHIIKIIKAPEETEDAREDGAAPSADAATTAVRSTKENSNTVNNNNNNYFNDDNSAVLKARSGMATAIKNDDKADNKLAISHDSAEAEVNSDNKNDADGDVNDRTNNKRNEDAKKCRRDDDKKHRAVPPLLSVLQGMGF